MERKREIFNDLDSLRKTLYISLGNKFGTDAKPEARELLFNLFDFRLVLKSEINPYIKCGYIKLYQIEDTLNEIIDTRLIEIPEIEIEVSYRGGINGGSEPSAKFIAQTHTTRVFTRNQGEEFSERFEKYLGEFLEQKFAVENVSGR